MYDSLKNSDVEIKFEQSFTLKKHLQKNIFLLNKTKPISIGFAFMPLVSCGGSSAPTVAAPPAPTPPAPTPPATSTFQLVSTNTYLASNNNNGTFSQSSSTADLTVTGLGGNDTITTGSGNDAIRGGGGNDIINSGAGVDVVEGGAGADNMNGGSGFDWISYNSSTSAININLATGSGSGGHAQGDTFSNFELVLGSNYNDTITGDANDNFIEGGDGADTIDGGAGIDFLSFFISTSGVIANLATGAGTGGDASGDTYTNIYGIFGSDYNDTLTGDANINELYGGNGNDTLNGGGNSDLLDGEDGNDTLNGDDGNDLIRGGAGADTMDGGSNTASGDTLSYTTSTGGVTVNLLTGVGSGSHAQGDTFVNFENVNGSDFADTITGDAGNNEIDGWKGVDTIDGGAGDDSLLAFQIDDSHEDSFDGGADIDTIEFIGTSTITAYNIDLSTIDVVNIEYISLSTNIGVTRKESLTLTAQDVLDVTDVNDQLIISGDANDIVTSVGQGWVQGADQVIDAETYNVYTSGAATLLVDADINLTIS